MNTRLAKLDAEGGAYDALILAQAGLVRIGFDARIGQVLEDGLYAVGQGALAIECREDSADVRAELARIHHAPTAFCCVAERCDILSFILFTDYSGRALLRSLEGGCSLPLGVRSSWAEGTLSLDAAVYSLDGKQSVRTCLSLAVASEDDASTLGYDPCASVSPANSSRVVEWSQTTSSPRGRSRFSQV